MEKLRVAVLPSLQDTNRFADPVTGKTTNELVQMHALADTLLVVNGRTSGATGIWMQKFTGRAYSAGDWAANLVAQQRWAHAWLNEASVPTVALNLHTDGVGWTHVGYYWDGKAAGSEELGKHLASALLDVFGTTKLTNADYGAKSYYFAREMVDPDGGRHHRPVLLEIGDHLVRADNLVVAEKAEEIAERIVEGLVWVFGLPWPSSDPWAKWPDMTAELRAALVEGGHAPNARAKEPYRRDADGDEVAKLSDGRWAERRAYTGAVKVRDW